MTLRVSLRDTERALSRPTGNAQRNWTAREACIVTLQGDDGQRGFGEASPLPGFSSDSLVDCRRALSTVDVSNVPARLAPGQSVLVELERASRALPSNLPAARTALEAALLDLWSRATGLPAWALLNHSRATPTARPVAALLTGEPEAALELAQRALARGVHSFKFKIGRPDAIERELAAVQALRTRLGADVALRLDANRSLSARQVAEYIPRFSECRPEFIEEPCAFAEFSRAAALGAPFALDESLAELDALECAEPFRVWGVRALVLKPTLLGGISACCAWADLARSIGAHVIVSHAFESSLGLALSAALALSIGSSHSAHGLDLEGARLDHLDLPFFSGSEIVPWSEPGFGLSEPEA